VGFLGHVTLSVEIVGYNAVEEEKRNPLKELGKKFWNVIAWILEIAAVLSFVLGRYWSFCL